MSRMGDAAKRNEKRGQVWGGRGGAKGERLSKVRKNTCRHGDFKDSCTKCIREANAATNRQTRIRQRAKRVNKAKKKGKCSLFALILLGAVGSLGWGTVELVSRII